VTDALKVLAAATLPVTYSRIVPHVDLVGVRQITNAEWIASVTHSRDTRVSGDTANSRHEVYPAQELSLWSSYLN
jgi:hypothetical protein